MAQKLYLYGFDTEYLCYLSSGCTDCHICCRSQCVQAIARVAGKNHISRLIWFLHWWVQLFRHCVLRPLPHSFIMTEPCCYPHQGGVADVCLSVSLLATLPKNFRTDLHEIFREGWQWTNEQKILVTIRITIWIQGLFFRFVTIGIVIRKVVNGHKSAAHTD